MVPTRTSPQDYRQRLQVETPEHVVLDLELAGVGSRALAALIDLLVLIAGALTLFAGLVAIAGLGVTIGSLGGAVLMIGGFAAFAGYFVLFEGLRRGQTPGKRAVGIRVVSDTGNAVGLGAAAARNLLRVADFLPPPYLIGALLVALHPRGKRLGDMVAGTVVARDRPSQLVATRKTDPGATTVPVALIPELTDGEFRVLAQFESRQAHLAAPARTRLAAAIARRLPAIPPRRARATWTTCSSSTGASGRAGRAVWPGRGRRPSPRSPPGSAPGGPPSRSWPSARPATDSTASPHTSCRTSPPAIGRSQPTSPGRGPTAPTRPRSSTWSGSPPRDTTPCIATGTAPGAGSGRCWSASVPAPSGRPGGTSPWRV